MTLAIFLPFSTACLLTLPTLVSPYVWDSKSEIEQNTVDLSLDSMTGAQSDSHLTSQTSKSKFEVGFNAGFNTGIKGFIFCTTDLTGLLIKTCEKATQRAQLKIRNKSYRKNRRNRTPEKKKKRRRKRSSEKQHRNNYHKYQQLSRSKRDRSRSRTLNRKKYFGIWQRFNKICCDTKCRPQDEAEIFDTCASEPHFRFWFLTKLYKLYSKTGSRNNS